MLPGFKIGNQTCTCSVFCYADNVLFVSVAPRGIQKSIDAAAKYQVEMVLALTH